MSDSTEQLPDGWIKRTSKAMPGKTFYTHTGTARSVWRLSDVKIIEERSAKQNKSKILKCKMPTDLVGDATTVASKSNATDTCSTPSGFKPNMNNTQIIPTEKGRPATRAKKSTLPTAGQSPGGNSNGVGKSSILDDITLGDTKERQENLQNDKQLEHRSSRSSSRTQTGRSIEVGITKTERQSGLKTTKEDHKNSTGYAETTASLQKGKKIKPSLSAGHGSHERPLGKKPVADTSLCKSPAATVGPMKSRKSARYTPFPSSKPQTITFDVPDTKNIKQNIKSSEFTNQPKTKLPYDVFGRLPTNEFSSPLDSGQSCGLLQRTINFTADDDWEMHCTFDETPSPDLLTSHFDWPSDALMDTHVTGFSASDDSLESEPRLNLVIDTCSIGNLANILQLKKVVMHRIIGHESTGEISNYGLPHIIVPWQVLQELDVLKDNKDKKFSQAKQSKARMIVKLINTLISRNDVRIKLQSPLDDAQVLRGFTIQTPDDSIIKCCLSAVKNKSSAVILITEDINLINKCAACGIKACTYQSFVDSLLERPVYPRESITVPPDSSSSKGFSEHQNAEKDSVAKNIKLPANVWLPKPAENLQVVHPTSTRKRAPRFPSQSVDKNLAEKNTSTESNKRHFSSQNDQIMRLFEKMASSLYPILKHCVAFELEDAFGSSWPQISFKKPPWTTLKPVVETMNKHWMAVFGLVLPRHLNKDVKKLLDSLNQSMDIDKLSSVLKASVDIVRALEKARRPYSGKCADILSELSAVADMCQKILSGEDCSSILAENNESRTTDDQRVGTWLTSVFTSLATACENVKDRGGKLEAISVVWKLGEAYQNAITPPLMDRNVALFLEQLNRVSSMMAIQTEVNTDMLRDFIRDNMPLLIDGFSNLEKLAISLNSLPY